MVDGPLVVGVDESERSRDAIALGQQLARSLDVAVMPLYVHTLGELDALMTGARLDEVEQLVREDAERKLARIRALAEELDAPEVQLRQAPSAAEGLHDQAVESNAALVALGSSSRSGLGRVVPGGTAERLLSGSTVPVALAPNGYAGQESRHAAIGVGFDKSPEAEQATRWAAELAARSGSSLEILSVHAPMAFGGTVAGGAYGTRTVTEVLKGELQAASKQLSDSLAPGLAVDTHLFTGDPAAVLVERSQELDLLVLGSRGYGPIKSVLLGSVSSHVSRNAHCPILVVPRGAEPREL